MNLSGRERKEFFLHNFYAFAGLGGTIERLECAARKTAFFSVLIFLLSLILSAIIPAASDAHTLGTVPYWPQYEFAPVQWPADGKWIPYSWGNAAIYDKRELDDTNGGTRPQNYVNVSSGCPDQSLPSIYIAYDTAADVLFFRWRVEQIPNTYGTGPDSGAFSDVEPWKAAQWTVMMDIDGDGYREYGMQLDGATGMPAYPVDILRTVYSNTLSQNMDPHDRGIFELWHNPTAFVDPATNMILNFQGTNTPVASWPNGPAETVWDYGTTRAINISTSSCVEYFVDYQIPMGMLRNGTYDFDCENPTALFFSTANSLTNPFQKDIVASGSMTATPDNCVPFGNPVVLCGQDAPIIVPQPVVDWISVYPSGCEMGITSQVRGAVYENSCSPNITGVNFLYYFDANGDDEANDGNTWQPIGAGVQSATDPRMWTFSWDTTGSGLRAGQYLIGAEAVNSIGYHTFSHLDSGTYVNPSPIPGVQYGSALVGGGCGETVVIDKTASANYVATGQNVQFTITIHNNTGGNVNINSITDYLPKAGNAVGQYFTYVSTDGGTGALAVPPAGTSSGTPAVTVIWDFSSSPRTIASGETAAITFTAQAPAIAGTYENTCRSNVRVASWNDELKDIACNYVQVGVGTPDLSIQKTASVATAQSAPPTRITYTISYSNKSPIGATNVVIEDVLPNGLTYVAGSATGGGSYYSGNPARIVWNIPYLPPYAGPYQMTFLADVKNPFPDSEGVKQLNVARISSAEMPTPIEAEATVLIVDVTRPLLTIQKNGNRMFVDPSIRDGVSNRVVYTINFANIGNGPTTTTTMTDQIPTDWSFVSAVAGTNCPAGVYSAGPPARVMWTIGPLAAGAKGSCNLTLQANYQNVNQPYAGDNPSTNTAVITGTYTSGGSTYTLPNVSSSFSVGITGNGGGCQGQKYYFKQALFSPAPEYIINTTIPDYSVPSLDSYLPLYAGSCTSGTYYIFGEYYTDPPLVNDATNQAINAVLYFGKRNGNQATFRATVYDYDPENPTAPLGNWIWQGILNDTGANHNPTGMDFVLNPNPANTIPPIAAGHRLHWVIDGCSKTNTGGASTEADFYWDGLWTDPAHPNNQIQTPSNFCYQGLSAIMNKRVDKTTVLPTPSPYTTLSYTITFGNNGGTNLTGAYVLDALPTGLTFDNATLNGAAVTCSASGQTVNCPVRSNELPAPAMGTITAFRQGTLVINAHVNYPFDSGVFTLVNTAELRTNETEPVIGTATTQVLASITINKLVDPINHQSVFYPGDIVPYTIRLINTSGSIMTGISVSDDLPLSTYLTYDSGTAPSGTSGNTYTWSNINLTPGQVYDIAVNLRVGTSDVVPLGTTYVDNTAVVTYVSGSVTEQYSNTVSATIMNAPRLSLSKSASASPVEPGATVTYSLTLTNTGSQDAYDVMVADPIPDSTRYTAGTIHYTAVLQTDPKDGDNAYFDPVENTIIYNIGILPAGASRTMSFDVVVDATMPQGTTIIVNTATASSSNAYQVQATANVDVQAAPGLVLIKSASPLFGPYPLTTLAAAVSGGSSMTVNNTDFIHVGDKISVNASSRTVISLPGGNVINLDGPVTGSIGDSVIGTISVLPNSTTPFTYSLYYKNTGNADATNVEVRDTLPAGLVFQSADHGGTNNGGTINWNLGTVAPGVEGTLHVTVLPAGPAPCNYNNSGSIWSDGAKVMDSNSVSTAVCPLALDKTTSTPSVTNTTTGVPATYTITVTNPLNATVTGVQVTDNFSSGFTYNGGAVFGGSGNTRTAVIDPAIGSNHPVWGTWSIDPGGSVTIQFNTLVGGWVPAGTYQNAVTALSSNYVVYPFDELSTSAEDVTVNVPVDLSVTKTVDNSTPHTGNNFVYTITLTNAGVNNSFFVNLSDLLPAKVTYASHTVSQGSYDYTTGIWNVGRVNRGANAVMTITAYPNNGTAGTTIQNCASLISSVPRDMNPANNQGCVDITPTLVSLADFKAYVEGGQVVVEWETAAELRTAGFYLYRYDEKKGKFVKVTEELLPGLLTAPEGGFYRLTDKSAIPSGSYLYQLEEVEQTGDTTIYGPFQVDLGGNPESGKVVKEFGSDGTIMITIKGDVAVTTRSAASVSAAEFEAVTDSFSRKSRGVSASKTERLASAQNEQGKTKLQKKNRKGAAIKMSVAENGLYYADAQDISSKLDMPLQQVKMLIKNSLLNISSADGQVAYIPAKDNTGLFFYGKAVESIYTNEKILWLYPDKGVQMESVDGSKQRFTGDNKSSFNETVHGEQDLVPLPTSVNDPKANYWYWGYVMAGNSSLQKKSFTFRAQPAATGANAEVTVHMMGGTDSKANPDHHVVVSLNGNKIGEGKWDGLNLYDLSVNIDQALLRDGDNTIEIKAVLDKGVPYSIFYIDSFDVSYARRYEAANDMLLFKAEGSPQINIGGFSTQDISVFDISEPLKPKAITGAVVGGQAGNYNVKFSPAGKEGAYIAVAAGAIKNSELFADLSSDLKRKNNAADYIVITPEEFKDSAELLATYRQSKGMSVKVALLEDIMDEFNNGMFDPSAIKSFLEYSYRNWSKKPAYAVILGEGTYDYRNVMGYGGNMVPPLMIGTPIGLMPSDNTLGDFDGDSLPEIIIGRIPVLTSAELVAVINKIKSFESAGGEGIILVADKPDGAGNFTKDSDDIGQLFIPGHTVQRIYLSDYQLNQARTLLFEGFKRGAEFVNYIGHASVAQLSKGGLLKYSDVPGMVNTTYPIMTMLTCAAGNFSIPGADSLGELLVIQNGGGIVSSWAPTGWSYNNQAKQLGEGFYKAVLQPDVTTMGDAVTRSMSASRANGVMPFMRNVYNILGDPALRIR